MTSFVFVYSGLLIMAISNEDKILIKNLWKSKGYSVRRFIKEFPNKNWFRMGLDYVLKKLRQKDTVERKDGSGQRHSTADMAIEQWR